MVAAEARAQSAIHARERLWRVAGTGRYRSFFPIGTTHHMAQFIVRVELHGAQPDAYSKLDQRMKALGFIRTLVGDRNVEYYLPTGEYLYGGNMTPESLLNQLVPHVSAIDPQNGIVVTEYQSQKLWFTGLKPVA